MVLWARTVMSLLQPPASLLMVVLAGAILLKLGLRKTGKALVVLGVSLLYLLSTGLVSNLLMSTLEDDYSPLVLNESQKADAVVVLASGVVDLSHLGLEPAAGGDSLKRLAYGIRLHRRLKGVPLVISGGAADPAKPGIVMGEVLGREAIALGVSKRYLLIENASRNTLEGAINLKAMLKGKRVILVTSAYHMGRAARLFEWAGFEVVPAPTAFMADKVPVHVSALVPTAGALCRSSTAVYEYLSRLWYLFKDSSLGKRLLDLNKRVAG